MSDLAEDFKAMTRLKKERHLKWWLRNVKIIKQANIHYTWSSQNQTCMLFREKVNVDFYPHTGRWKYKNKMYNGGAERFINWYDKLISLQAVE